MSGGFIFGLGKGFASAAVLVAAAVTALPLSAITVHRSFRSRDVGFGGGAGVSVPVDSRLSAALDEAARKEAERTKVVIGRCTRVQDANTVCVITDGNVKFMVRLDGLSTPLPDSSGGKLSAEELAKRVRGKQVRVEWVKKDARGCLVARSFGLCEPRR